MLLGMSLEAFTLLHVVISIAGIASGALVTVGMLNGNRMNTWTATFLATTILTSATGYLFPFQKVLPSHIVGAISLAILAVAVVARYPCDLAGSWRTTYVVTAMIAFYLNVFVLVVQAFLKVPALRALAPTGTEGPFKVAQLIVLCLFAILTTLAVRRF